MVVLLPSDIFKEWCDIFKCTHTLAYQEKPELVIFWVHFKVVHHRPARPPQANGAAARELNSIVLRALRPFIFISDTSGRCYFSATKDSWLSPSDFWLYFTYASYLFSWLMTLVYAVWILPHYSPTTLHTTIHWCIGKVLNNEWVGEKVSTNLSSLGIDNCLRDCTLHYAFLVASLPLLNFCNVCFLMHNGSLKLPQNPMSKTKTPQTFQQQFFYFSTNCLKKP